MTGEGVGADRSGGRAFLTALLTVALVALQVPAHVRALAPLIPQAAAGADGDVLTWTSRGNLPAARFGATSIATNGFVYVIGGAGFTVTDFGGAVTDSVNTVFRSAINLDGSLAGFTSVAAMNTSRLYPAAIAQGGYLYVFGGFKGGNTRNDWAAVSSIERAAVNADGTLGAWTTLATSLTSARGGVGIFAPGNGRAYIVGGEVGFGTTSDIALATVESIDFNSLGGTTAGSWRSERPLPAARRNAETVGIGQRALVTGGYDSSLQVTKTVYRGDVATDGSVTWSTDPIALPVLQGVAEHAAAYDRGFLYIAGGVGNQTDTMNWIAVAADGTLTGSWHSYPPPGTGPFATTTSSPMIAVGSLLYYVAHNFGRTDTLEITLERDADLGVSVSHTPEPVTAGNVATTTITVRNNGPSDATHVSATINVPQSDLPTSVAANQGSCTQSSIATGSPNVAGSAAVGAAPQNVAVNPATHRGYVTNQTDGTMSVLDLTTNVVIATVATGPQPYGVTVNPATNRIYVSNFGAGARDAAGTGQSVSVIDGSTNQVIHTLNVFGRPRGIAAVPSVNKIYVGIYRTDGGADNNKVAVIDGASDTVSPTLLTTDFGAGGSGMVADGTSVYVPNGSVALTGLSKIDATTNAVTTPTYASRIGNGAIAVNPNSHRVYLGDTNSSTLFVLDGASLAPLGTVSGGSGSLGLALVPSSNHLYANNGAGVTLLDASGALPQVTGSLSISPSTSVGGIGVDPSTNTVYAADQGGSRVVRIADQGSKIIEVCSLGGIAAGGSARVTLTYAPSAPGRETTTASVTGTEFDPVSSNNSASDTLTVIEGLAGTAECRTTNGSTITTTPLPGTIVRLYSGSALVATTLAASVDSRAPGQYVFAGLAPNATYTVRYAGTVFVAEFAQLISCSATVHTDASGGGLVPEPTPLLNRLNHLWFRPYHLKPGVPVADVIPVPGQSTWYRVTVGPHQRLTFRLTNPPTQYTALAFTDLFKVARQLKLQGSTLAGLRLLDGTQDRAAPDLDSPDLDSPDLDSPDLDSPDLDSPDLDSPDLDSPDLDSPDLDSPDLDSPDLDSPDLDSPDLDSSGKPVPASQEVQTFGTVYVAAQRHGLRAFSAHPGPVPQTIVINTRDYQGDVYLRVRPHGDLSSSDTFNVVATVEGGAGCLTAPLVQRAPAAPTFASGPHATLVLTNTGPGWFTEQAAVARADFRAALNAFATRKEVSGVVVDLNDDPNLSLSLADWRAAKTCVAQANLVARSVKQVVDLYRAQYGIQYLVIAAPDPGIPFFRARDDAELSKESRYSGGLDALSAGETALTEDYVFTDSFYGASGPTTRSGHDFYLSDLAIGRLVETPSDILSYLTKYPADGGVDVQRAFSSGYGFVSDLAAYETNSLAHAGATVDSLNSDTWSADDLRGFLFSAQRYQVLSLQGHGRADRLVPANDGPRLLSSEIAGVADGRFAGTFVMSLACHLIGFDLVHGEQLPGTNAVSFPEAFLAQGATTVGETGFGYGHYPLLKNGEVVMAFLADELSFRADLGGTLYGRRGVPVGKALNIAKLRFLNTLADVRGIEAKVINETVVYGAPMFAVRTPNSFARPAAPTVGALTSLNTTQGLWSADVTSSFTLNQHQLGNGTYFDAGTLDDTATFAFRPIIPAKVVGVQATLPSGGDVVPRGAVLLSAQYGDIAGFVPALAIPATQDALTSPPTSYTSTAFAPGRLIRLDEFAGDTAVFIPFQFKGNGASGTARTFSAITAKLYYSTLTGDAALVDAPGIQAVTLTRDLDAGGAPTGLVRVSVTVSGRVTPDVQDVWETYTATSGPLLGSWKSTRLSAGPTTLGRPGTGTLTRVYSGTIDPADGTVAPRDPTAVLVDIQAVGGNGLASYATNGGLHYQIVDQTATAASPKRTPSLAIVAPASATYRAKVPVTATLLNAATGAPIAGKRVVFKFGGSFAAAITGATGVASATLVANAPPDPEPYRITASVEEDLDLLAGGAEAAILVQPGPTQFVPAGAALDSSDSGVVAQLVLASRNTPLEDERVVIDLGARGKVSTYTDRSGGVRFNTSEFGLGPGTYTARLSYAGQNVAHPELSRLAATAVTIWIVAVTVRTSPQPATAPVTFGGTIIQAGPLELPPGAARGDITTAAVHYVVQDESGAVVGEATAPVTANADGSGNGSWSVTLTLVPGVYTVSASAGGSFFTSSVATALLPVFDPTEFVTGGGDVVTSATNSRGLAVGRKANFGFNLKYHVGALIPRGDLLFQAKESKVDSSRVDFKATSFDWLVITPLANGDHRAEFEGSGTVNDVAGWRFRAVAQHLAAGDTFEIRITNPTTGATYFVSATLGGGSIVIH